MFHSRSVSRFRNIERVAGRKLLQIPSRISELVNGQRPITADTALRLGMFFGMEPRFWLNLQAEYDMRIADRELRAKLVPRIHVFQPAAG